MADLAALPRPARILVVSDAPSVRREVRSVLEGGDVVIGELDSGPAVTPAVKAQAYDLVVADMQIASMGGMAVCMDLRLEESGGRLDHVAVLMLLDRRADVFLARRSGAEGWVVKPLDPIRLAKAVASLLAGGTYHDTTYLPAGLVGA